MTQRFKVGDKVIPINKTVEDSTEFRDCPHAQAFLSGEVEYLTVTDVVRDFYVCSSRNNGSGNYYNHSDLEPYSDVLNQGVEI